MICTLLLWSMNCALNWHLLIRLSAHLGVMRVAPRNLQLTICLQKRKKEKKKKKRKEKNKRKINIVKLHSWKATKWGSFCWLKLGCHIWHFVRITWPAAWVGRYVCVFCYVCSRFVVICYHVLIRQTVAPESLGGRQRSVLLLVSDSVFRDQTCCLLHCSVCSVSRPTRVQTDTQNTHARAQSGSADTLTALLTPPCNLNNASSAAYLLS